MMFFIKAPSASLPHSLTSEQSSLSEFSSATESQGSAIPQALGTFHGEVITKWIQHDAKRDRCMELLSDFVYVDPNYQVWCAHTGSTVDGASIPRWLWTIMGAPFVGNYRRASVLHDVACKERKQPHQDVHRMFHNAMLCDGVPPRKARLMYWAVSLFGPRW